MSYILGINIFHGDSSACIIHNGKLIAAAEEERFTRIKHFSGFPIKSIEFCLCEAEINLSQVNEIAINHSPKAHILRKLLFTILRNPSLSMVWRNLRKSVSRINAIETINTSFGDNKFNGTLVNVEHHLAHLYSAFIPSSFDTAVVVSIDGFGDFASTSWGVGQGNSVLIDGQIYFPHSLGIFYQAITQYLGFNNYGDEYKVMGLAPYGNPKYVDKISKLISFDIDGTFQLELKYFRHHKFKIGKDSPNGAPNFESLFSNYLEELLGPKRGVDEILNQYHMDIAHSTQVVYEEALYKLLNKLHEKYKIDSLALAGGCAMNSVANGKIKLKTPFKQVYVQAAAGDAGGALGAAYYRWFNGPNEMALKKSRDFHSHAYWGPSYSNDQISATLDGEKERIKEANCEVIYYADFNYLASEIASYISMGNVVGWFQGPMEWGNRALGNRSILCDPRRSDMKDILNKKIKKRESFRPFAPSILREEVENWFEQDGEVPFMSEVYQIKKEKRTLIPAVTHVDGSGRLQTVQKTDNLRFHTLILKFFNKTQIPMLLNTSFNENEPVVCNPKEALDCFLRTKMDILVLGDWVIFRR
jgi:carbamoyltransferase